MSKWAGGPSPIGGRARRRGTRRSADAMRLHFCFVPDQDPEQAENELNAFLAGRRVLAINREFVSEGAHA